VSKLKTVILPQGREHKAADLTETAGLPDVRSFWQLGFNMLS